MTIFEAILAADVAGVGDALRANPQCVNARLPEPKSGLSVLDAVRANAECVNARDEHGWTPLHLVAALGVETKPSHAHIAEELCAKGGDVNARTGLGWTPIHIIAMHGTKESLGVAKCLIQHGADLGATTKHGANWRLLWQHGQEILELLSRHSQRST